MTSKEKREYAILAVLLIGIGWVVYTNFFPKSSPPTATEISLTTPSGTASGTNMTSNVITGKLLPYGATLDLGILSDTRFKSLVPPQYPRVTKDQVGQTNPFGQ